MFKRIIILSGVFVLLYAGLVKLQMFVVSEDPNNAVTARTDEKEETMHKVYSFSFSKYTPTGEKEIDIEGDSANILAKTVQLMNVVAKAYAEETPVTITSDEGQYDKEANIVHLQKNVVATTEDGARLLTEELNIHPSEKKVETPVEAEVKKDNINIDGTGAAGDSLLKKVKFKKNVTVVIKDSEEGGANPTIITCDGPLDIDYERNIAHFQKNVVARDGRGTLKADLMDVYYSRVSRKVSKMIATGHVVIENPDGNQTYSDSVIYLADEGRIILGGDTETLYYDGGHSGTSSGVGEVFDPVQKKETA